MDENSKRNNTQEDGKKKQLFKINHLPNKIIFGYFMVFFMSFAILSLFTFHMYDRYQTALIREKELKENGEKFTEKCQDFSERRR